MSSTITTSVVTGGSNSHATVSSEANAYATDFVAQGILGTFTNTAGVAPATGSFAVNADASPDMGITILGTGNTTSGASIAYVKVTPSSQDLQVLRARMTADYTSYTINSNATGSTVYDWIYLQASATNANTPSSAADNVITLVTSRSTSSSTDNGSPPTYGILLAVVTVANGASSITNANISDRRTQVTLNVGSTSNTNGWQTLNYPLTYATNAGSKEFTVTSPNDLTGTLSVGMRLSIARSVTPPTQCMSFTASSSQYATKSSPTGITFTGAFAAEAWIYVNSITGSNMNIISRSDSGSSGGFGFQLNTLGQLRIFYGSGSSFTDFISNTIVPTKKWVHVAGVVTSVASKTAVLYINGTAVTASSSLTAATSLTQQSVDIRIGARSGTATDYFDGYISAARLWSASRTAANIQDNMTVSLVGNESNLVGLWQGNGNFNDATSNANNLTANGSAIATQASNPYNATEYGIITAISYSNPTTTITLFTGHQYMIPNMTLNTPRYSLVKVPYGFNPDETNWVVSLTSPNDRSTASASLATLTDNLIVPIGSWKLESKIPAQFNGPTSTNARLGTLTWSTDASTETTPRLTSVIGVKSPSAAVMVIDSVQFTSVPVILTTDTTFTLMGKVSNADSTVFSQGAGNTPTVLRATCGYL